MISDNYRTAKWLRSIFYGWFDPCPLNPSPLIVIKQYGLVCWCS